MGQGLAIEDPPPPEIPDPLLVATAAAAWLVGIQVPPGRGLVIQAWQAQRITSAVRVQAAVLLT